MEEHVARQVRLGERVAGVAAQQPERRRGDVARGAARRARPPGGPRRASRAGGPGRRASGGRRASARAPRGRVQQAVQAGLVVGQPARHDPLGARQPVGAGAAGGVGVGRAGRPGARRTARRPRGPGRQARRSAGAGNGGHAHHNGRRGRRPPHPRVRRAPPSPAGDVALHDPEALRELDPGAEAARRGPEGLDVVGGQRAQAVVALAHGLGVEAQLAALAEREPAEVLGEADRAAVRGGAVDPDRPLGGGRVVVDAVDQVPGQRAPVRRAPDAGGPPPRGLARVVAGRVVDEPAGVDGAGEPVEPDACRPRGPAACASRSRGARGRRSPRRARRRPRGAGRPRRRARGSRSAAVRQRRPRAWGAGACARAARPSRAVPHGPEGLRRRADADQRPRTA